MRYECKTGGGFLQCCGCYTAGLSGSCGCCGRHSLFWGRAEQMEGPAKLAGHAAGGAGELVLSVQGGPGELA